MAKKNQRVIGASGFNALAIIVVLAVYPLATGWIASAGQSSPGETWNDVLGNEIQDGFMANYDSYWYNNGNYNATSAYQQIDPNEPLEAWECIKIVGIECTDLDGVGSTRYSALGGLGSWSSSEDGFYYQSARQTHKNQPVGYLLTWPAPLVQPSSYYGYSGNGNFQMWFGNLTLDGIENGKSLDSLRFVMVDRNTVYNCNHIPETNITIEYSIDFYVQDPTQTQYGFLTAGKRKIASFDDFETTTSNVWVEKNYLDGFTNDVCYYGFILEFDFSSFETLQIENGNSNQWNETMMMLKIDHIEKKNGDVIGATPLPFAGIEDFDLAIQTKQLNPAVVNFATKSLTALMTVGTFALALASTPYWNPVRNFFKGVGN